MGLLNLGSKVVGGFKTAAGEGARAAGKTTAGKMLWGNKTNLALSSGFSYMTYDDALNDGKTKSEALGEAAFTFGTTALLGPVAGVGMDLLYHAGPAMVGIANDLTQQGRQQAQQSYRPFSWTNPVNSQQYATMRQAGMALAQQSQYSLQTTMMGQEGKAFHK